MQNRLITYRDAIAEATAQEMRRDKSVIVFGLDVTDHKRIFGSTAGLLEEFGPERVFATPLSEDAMTGVALGAAITGLRPIHIHIRVDFLMLAMNQLTNMISSYSYLTGGAFRVPLVIRAVIGRGWGQGAQHSKTLHAVFSHIPGLKVIMPTTPKDAKGLLTAAIRNDSPVICLEHRWLYDVVGEVPAEPYTVDIGLPSIVREGKDLTVVATSWMVVEALQAAEWLSARGIELEVIDVRSITPLDVSLIARSIRKTRRALVADYDWARCGFSAELVASLTELCFSSLKAPIGRLAFEAVPCPTTRCLENRFYPNAVDIVRFTEKALELSQEAYDPEALYSWTHRFKGPF